MSSRPKSIQPPPSPPELEARLGRNRNAPPDWENDRALRYTWLRPFAEPERAAVLEQLADLLTEWGRETNRWGGGYSDDLAAVADDLNSLTIYLLMLAEAIGEGEVDDEEKVLVERAEAWAGRLGLLIRDIRRAVCAEDSKTAGQQPFEALTLASVVVDDLGRVLECLLAVHSTGAGGVSVLHFASPRLRGALGLTLARVSEASTVLREAVMDELGDGEDESDGG